MPWAVGLLLAVFVALGLLYNVTTPIFEAPGETSHYLYVRGLLDGQGLPWRGITGGDSPPEEPLHPPLFYLLGAAAVAGVDVGSEQACLANPYASIGQPDLAGNKNAVLHVGDESWPYRGTSLAVHVLRLLSTLLGAGTVYLTWLTGRMVLPQRPPAALAAAGLVALNPQFIFISASATNDALAALLGSAALYLALCVAGGRARGDRHAAIFGAVVGLGMLTKVSLAVGTLLLPLACGAELWRRRSAEDAEPGTGSIWLALGRPSLIGLACAFAVAGWWYLVVFLHSASPPNLMAFARVLGAGGLYDGAWRALRPGVALLDSYWGLFGWMNVRGAQAYYVFARLLTLVGLGGLFLGLAWAFWTRSLSRLPWNTLGLVAAWALLNGLVLAFAARSLTGQQGRYLFPAAGAIALLLTLGLSVLATPSRPWLVGGAHAGLLIGALLAPWQTIAPAYALPLRTTLEAAPSAMQDVGVRFGEDIFLLGQQTKQTSVQPGREVRVRLYWLALGDMDEDLAVSLRIYGRDDVVIGQLDTYPGMGTYPTRIWVPGEVICDDYVIPIAVDAQAPTAASLRVGIYRRQSLEHLAARDAAGNDVGTGPQIARLRVVPVHPDASEPMQAAQLQFGDGIALEGYDVTRGIEDGQQALKVTLYWRRVGPLSQDWTVFVHLVDGVGNLLSQDDRQPAHGYYPTTFWDLNERVVDQHTLLLPASLAPGQYNLHLGFYLLGTEERLPVSGDGSQGNYALLGPVTIGESGP